jgi:hypothetical protein
MSQSQRARITRLENRVATFAAARVTASDTETGADEDGYLERDLFDYILVRAVNLAYLIKFGDPRIDEPLSQAWKRTGYRGEYDPFESFGAVMVGNDLLSGVFPRLPGFKLKEKLSRIFETAPAWLIWFTHGETFAHMLDLKLPPDLLDVVRYARPADWSLPRGAFEMKLWPNDARPRSQLEDYYMRMAGLMHTRVSRRQSSHPCKQPSPPAQLPIRWPDA